MLGYFYRKRFDLYYPIAHPDTRRISFTYVPVASMWVIAIHNLFLYSDQPPPCHPPSYWLRLFWSQTFSHINTPTFSNLVILHTYPPVKMEQSVPKHRHIKFRRRGITKKNAYNIQNTAKVWNQNEFHCSWASQCHSIIRSYCFRPM